MLATTDSYPLDDIPEATNKDVVEHKEKILNGLKLDKILIGLNNCQGLINIARHGVAGFSELEVKMTNLQASFAKLCGKTQTELNNFGHASEKIMNNLLDIVDSIYNDQLKDVPKQLEGFSKVAEDLSKRATDLASEFGEAAKTALDVTNAVQRTHGLESAKKAEVEAKIKKFVVDIEEAKILIEGITKQKERLEKAYEDAQKKAEKHEDRAFTLAVTSAIATPLAAGLGTFAGVYFNPAGQIAGAVRAVGPKFPLEQPLQQAEDVAKGQAAEQEVAVLQLKLDETNKQKKRSEEEVKCAEDKVKEAKGELDRYVQKKKDAEDKMDDLKDKKEILEVETKIRKLEAKIKTSEQKVDIAEKAAKRLRDALDEKEEEAKKLEDEKKFKGAVIQGVATGLKEIGDTARTEADNYTSLAATFNQEKVKYLDLLIAKEKEEYEQKAHERTLAVQISQFTREEDALEQALASLFMAIGALKDICSTLNMAASFWTNMGEACKRLKDSDLKGKVESNSSRETREERLQGFNNKRFKQCLYMYLVGWKALYVVCKDYATDTGKIQDRVWEDFKENLSVKTSREKARALCADLLKGTLNELIAIEERKKLAEEERDNLKATLAITAK